MSNLVEKLREENAFLNDMLENAHNRSRILEQQLTDGNNITIAHSNTISRVEAANVHLQDQLAEARGESERLNKDLGWANKQIQLKDLELDQAIVQIEISSDIARQEAARTIERHLLGMFWCIPSKENEPMIYRDQAIEWLRGCYGLEG